MRKARGYIEKANVPLPARLETWNFLQRLGTAEVLHPDLQAQIDVGAPFVSMQQVWDSTPSKSLLNHMLYYDWHYTLADNDLRKVGAVCALADVKVSYPMLHPAVVEMSTRVSPDTMMPGRKLRHFYKQAVVGFLPDRNHSQEETRIWFAVRFVAAGIPCLARLDPWQSRAICASGTSFAIA